jgi:hypothetical protein
VTSGPATIRLEVINASATTLYAKSAKLHLGHPLSPATATIQPGHQMVFSGSGDIDCSGTLELYLDKGMTGDHFAVSYAARSPQLTPVRVSSPAGFSSGIEQTQNLVGGTQVRVALYDGKLANAATNRYVIDLTSHPRQLADKYPFVYADFVNSMFDPPKAKEEDKLRTIDAIDTAIDAMPKGVGSAKAGAVYFADYSAQLAHLVAGWLDNWLHGTPFNIADDALIGFLKTYFMHSAPRQVLWLPRLSVAEYTPGQAAVFNLEGYDSISLSNAQGWIAGGVTKFLYLLASGAHMVSICAEADLRPVGIHYSIGRDIYHQLVGSDLSRGQDLGNSHYKGDGKWKVNMSGWYYLAIASETMPSTVQYLDGGATCDAGLLNAFLTCPTINDPGPIADETANYFIQLEGWQQQGASGGDRHMRDFDASNAAAWNISTFGASPYSEKRATTVFLAPPDWKPVPTLVTCMMPYVGAYGIKQADDTAKPQPWLRPDLVVLPDDAVGLLERYEVPA